jgi:hypothetical protein
MQGNRKRIKVVFLILLPILVLLLFIFIYVFSISFENHYNVRKGTLLWYITMDNQTITKFPEIKLNGKVTYNSIGGDSPSIAKGWEIVYTSNEDIEKITEEILEYLKNREFTMSEVEQTEYYWIGRHKRDEMNRLYSGVNKKKEEGLDLALFLQENGMTIIQCTITH